MSVLIAGPRIRTGSQAKTSGSRPTMKCYSVPTVGGRDGEREPATRAQYQGWWQKSNPEKVREYKRHWYHKNRDKARASAKVYRERNREALRTRNKELYRRGGAALRSRERHAKHGLPPGTAERLWESQEGYCALCHRPLVSLSKSHIDHDHETGKIRGLLHPQCNMALGLFDHDSMRVRCAVTYLDKHSDVTGVRVGESVI